MHYACRSPHTVKVHTRASKKAPIIITHRHASRQIRFHGAAGPSWGPPLNIGGEIGRDTNEAPVRKCSENPVKILSIKTFFCMGGEDREARGLRCGLIVVYLSCQTTYPGNFER